MNSAIDKDLAAVTAVATAATQAGAEPVLIGAGARRLRFDIPFDVDGRATTDWDLAIPVQSWAHFEIILRQLPAHRDRTVEHRVRTPEGTLVDLVPFGGVEDNAGLVTFGEGGVMNATGLAEAHSASTILEGGLRVANLAAVLGLKLIAFGDRPGQRRRDLEDVYFVVSQYAARAESDDIFSALGDDSLDHLSFEHLGAHLIGQRIAHCFTARSRVRITEVLREITRGSDDGPLTSLVPPMADDWDREHANIQAYFSVLLAACGAG